MSANALWIEQILKAATRFREAVNQYTQGECHRWFSGFPSGCCKTTSLLLARYVNEQGLGKPEYVWGMNPPKDRSHGWLQFKKLFVDITADQFKNENRSVLVTFDPTLYKQFEPHFHFEYDSYMRFNDYYKIEHDKIYESIRAIIKA